MEREYAIYKLTSPSGRFYIGLTKTTVKERWRQHVSKALKTDYNHPLYNAIRKYGAESFTVEQIDSANGKVSAAELEKHHISNSPKKLLYNISPGGESDGEVGGRIFWERINNNPQMREEYLKKLSDVKKTRDWSDYEAMSDAAKKWRAENPKEAYKLSYRASRIARRKQQNTLTTEYTDNRTLKERLMWKHKRAEMTRKNALEQWAKRTDEEKKIIKEKISKTQKERMRKIAVLPDFDPDKWPYAKATVLRKIRQGMNRDQIIADAIEIVKQRGSHWKEVEQKLITMGVLKCEHMTS